MRYRVLQPLTSREDNRLYKPGEIFDDNGRLTRYEQELLQAMGVVEPLLDEHERGEAPQQES